MKDGENHNFVPDDLSNYKIVCRGNLVINKMKAWQGSLGVSAYAGIVSPAYFVYNFQGIDLRFGHMLLRSKPYIAYFAQCSDGVRTGQWDLSIDGMKRIPVLIPPLSDQLAIITFLYHTEHCIQRYITIKRKLLGIARGGGSGLIHEFRSRLIADVITGKIDVREAAAHLPEIAEESDILDEEEIFDDNEEASGDMDETMLESVA
jgi:type I restriction enzyme S subunit